MLTRFKASLPFGNTDALAPTALREGGMPIAWLLSLVLIGLVLVAVLPVVLLGYFGARENTGRLMRDRSELVLDVVVQRITAHLDPVRAQLQHVALAVRQGVLNPDDESAMGAFVNGALAATPQVTGIAFVRPDLTVRRYNRSDYQPYDEASAANLPAVTQISLGLSCAGWDRSGALP